MGLYLIYWVFINSNREYKNAMGPDSTWKVSYILE